jgi:hypothetical protein
LEQPGFYVATILSSKELYFETTLIDVGSALSFDEDELNIFLFEILAPTLLSADTAIFFLIENLGSSGLAKRIKKSLPRRMRGGMTYFACCSISRKATKAALNLI